jgi:hypothetical protein
MTSSKIVEVLGAIALVTTLVSHPQTARVVTSFGNAFANSLRAAQGR